ncbi:hypothetical protein ACFVVX_36875 [Kitasatospora sp. NPDC058170]|uniref:hypothetical protein n=1 Tax=Kitasatospora sp. NPDC058170 TaxID=3346364 RepID=UPI0036D877B4
MDGPALSGRERRLLDEIEGDLRQDARLDRRLSTMGAKRPSRFRGTLRGLARRIPSGVVMTALVLSAICLSIGVRTPTAPVLTALALVWAFGVAVSVGVVVLLRRRRTGGHERGGPGEHRPWDHPEA